MWVSPISVTPVGYSFVLHPWVIPLCYTRGLISRLYTRGLIYRLYTRGLVLLCSTRGLFLLCTPRGLSSLFHTRGLISLFHTRGYSSCSPTVGIPPVHNGENSPIPGLTTGNISNIDHGEHTAHRCSATLTMVHILFVAPPTHGPWPPVPHNLTLLTFR